jgi:hypothetical protein
MGRGMAQEERVVGDLRLEKADTNLKILKPSRRPVREGDVFAFAVDDERYFFGRVIRMNVSVGGFPGGILIYLYRTASTSKEQVPRLQKEELLLPPLATNRLPWSRGYFETIASPELRPSDVLARHCFVTVKGEYLDEMSQPMTSPVEPVGEYSLHSFRSIDDVVSEALGIPQRP